jgi:hypothetical protein
MSRIAPPSLPAPTRPPRRGPRTSVRDRPHDRVGCCSHRGRPGAIDPSARPTLTTQVGGLDHGRRMAVERGSSRAPQADSLDEERRGLVEALKDVASPLNASGAVRPLGPSVAFRVVPVHATEPECAPHAGQAAISHAWQTSSQTPYERSSAAYNACTFGGAPPRRRCPCALGAGKPCQCDGEARLGRDATAGAGARRAH